ncbi:alpha/beta hydrolase [Roseomonas sp. BN140053]|uniref:alpha/beta hydrolase n=1 Tax=Roseomonas sp. BN140053 TaxID=3391898 RepID=UPI0039E7F126
MPTPPSDAPPSAAAEAAAVFLHYGQAELDRQYDQRHWDPNGPETVAGYAAQTAAARAQLGNHRSLRYGEGETDWLDLYPAAQPEAPIHVFLHGGAWRSLSRHDSGFAAPAFVAAGAHFVAPDFSVLPQTDLPGMVAQVRRALGWIHREARGALGGDPGRIHVSGHSSGAHLAACLLATDWAAEGLPAGLIRSGVLVSGLYDLRAVRLSSRQDYVKLTAESEAALSPLRHLGKIRCPVAVYCGDSESAEFSRQSRDFAAALREAGRLADTAVLAGRTHFTAVRDLGDPASRVGRTALQLMELTP